MEKKDWILIVSIIVLVAIISSFATIKLTGNIINVATSSRGTSVYTAVEVDAKIRMLNSSINNNTRILNETINNVTIVLNETINKLNNTIELIIDMNNNTIGGNWSVPGNVTINQTTNSTCIKYGNVTIC
jgi:hypothetical protein